MFHTIFGHVQYIEEAEDIRFRLEMITVQNEETNNIEIGLDSDEYTLGLYWVDLPGFHPVRLTHELVKEMNLWDAVISDQKLLQHLTACSKAGHDKHFEV